MVFGRTKRPHAVEGTSSLTSQPLSLSISIKSVVLSLRLSSQCLSESHECLLRAYSVLFARFRCHFRSSSVSYFALHQCLVHFSSMSPSRSSAEFLLAPYPNTSRLVFSGPRLRRSDERAGSETGRSPSGKPPGRRPNALFHRELQRCRA